MAYFLLVPIASLSSAAVAGPSARRARTACSKAASADTSK